MVAFFFPPPVKLGATRSLTQTDAVSNGASASFGADATGRQIVILVWHGDVGSSPGVPSATIGGVSATRYENHSTGAGGAHATGTAIFIANPTGTSGTVSVSWGAAPISTIIVLRLVGYSATPSSTDGGTTGSDDATTDLTATAGDCAIVIGGDGFSGSPTLTGITQQGSTSTRVWGWDTNKSAGAFSVTQSSWSFGVQGDGSRSGVTFPPV